MPAVRGTGHDEVMRAVDIVITVGWLAFWGYWLVSATNTKAGQGGWSRFVGVRVGVIIL